MAIIAVLGIIIGLVEYRLNDRMSLYLHQITALESRISALEHNR